MLLVLCPWCWLILTWYLQFEDEGELIWFDWLMGYFVVVLTFILIYESLSFAFEHRKGLSTCRLKSVALIVVWSCVLSLSLNLISSWISTQFVLHNMIEVHVGFQSLEILVDIRNDIINMTMLMEFVVILLLFYRYGDQFWLRNQGIAFQAQTFSFCVKIWLVFKWPVI